MKRSIPSLALVVALSFLPAPSPGSTTGTTTVDNFALLDHEGQFHELYYYAQDKDTKAIVLFVQGNGCPLVQKQFPELNQLQKEFPQAVFWMINANSQDSREEIAQEAKEFKSSIPILVDETQLVAEALNITRTAETIVIQPDSWKLVYRGPVSDRLSYQTEKPKAKTHYLRNTLAALINDKTIETKQVQSPGCKVNILDDDPDKHAQISYAKTIAPLLVKNCAECHSKGGLAPFAMSSFKKVRGWAEMIKEVVVTRQMPPWQADPHIGNFSNDFSLTPEEKKTLVHWIDAGTPRGDGPDPLASYKPPPRGWRLGQPDHVIDIPEQSLPAEGVLPYRYLTLDSPWEEDAWLTGVEVQAGNTRVLHHIIASTIEEREGKRPRRKAIAGYAPGVGPDEFPEGTGILLKKGARIRLQLHYTASGKPETDRSKIGLFYAKEPVETELHGRVVIHHEFEIPPNNRAYTVSKSHRFRQDVLLHSLFPHMHYRGKAMSYEAHYPDGTKKTLLSVPQYHFNWQRSYRFTQPIPLPKGTRLHVTATWDNSALNSYNPDPNATVRWGEQSWEEMFFAGYDFTYQ